MFWNEDAKLADSLDNTDAVDVILLVCDGASLENSRCRRQALGIKRRPGRLDLDDLRIGRRSAA